MVLRYLKFGRISGALPATARDGLALELAPATRVRWAAVGGRHVHDLTARERLSSRDWGSVERGWEGEGVVILGRSGRAHSIWHFWDGEEFAGWYVNLEAPWTPSAIGFDTEDHELDLWVEPDGSWRWKDEDHLQTAVEVGAYSPELAAEIRAEGERVLDEWPFPTGWEERRPAGRSPPTLPEGWDLTE